MGIKPLTEIINQFETGTTTTKLLKKHPRRPVLETLCLAEQQGTLSPEAQTRLGNRKLPETTPTEENRLREILSVANNEKNQAIIITLNGTPQIPSHIAEKLAHYQAQHTPGPNRIYEVLARLNRLGFTYQELIPTMRGHKIGHALTARGNGYLKPVAAASLEYAQERQISLAQLLGWTSQQYAPYTRLRITELVAAGYRSIKEISAQLRLTESTVAERVRILNGLQILAYRNREQGQPVTYTWLGGQITTVDHRRSLTARVAEALEKLGSATVQETTAALNYTNNENVREVLHGLSQQGVVEPDIISGTPCVVLGDNASLLLDYADLVRPLVTQPHILINPPRKAIRSALDLYHQATRTQQRI